jgi:hypothetical protein
MPSGRHGFMWFRKDWCEPGPFFGTTPRLSTHVRVRDDRYKDSNPYVYRFRIDKWLGGNVGGGLQDAVSGWIDSKDTGYGSGDRTGF